MNLAAVSNEQKALQLAQQVAGDLTGRRRAMGRRKHGILLDPVPFPFPPVIGAGRVTTRKRGQIINCYAEPLGRDVEAKKGMAPPAVVWRKSPGLSLFGASGQTGFRGSILVANTLYAAWSGKVSTFTSGGVETLLTGALTGTEKVFFARNNKATPDVVCVAPGTGAFSVSSAAVSSFADIDVGAPNSVCFMDSFFIFSYGDGTLQASGQNDVTIATTDKTQAQSKPGGLNAVPAVQRAVGGVGAELRGDLFQHGQSDRLSVHALLCAATRLAQAVCDRRT
jgi:hypothetical protein